MSDHDRDRAALHAIHQDIFKVIPPGFDVVVIVIAPTEGDLNATSLMSTLPGEATSLLLENFLARHNNGDGVVMNVGTLQ